MDAVALASFYEKTGSKVVRSPSGYWYSPSRGVMNFFPYRHTCVGSNDYRTLWSSSRALVARHTVPIVSAIGHKSCIYLCDPSTYSLDLLSANTRSKVRRGLKNCRVEQVDFDVLARRGLALQVSTLVRQDRKVPSNVEHSWMRMCQVAGQTPDFEAWGAFYEDQLAALAIGFVFDQRYHISVVRSAQSLLKYYPNNALVFEMVCHIASRPTLFDISYGLESVQNELTGLDSFKLDMGFRREPLKQYAAIRPLARPMLHASANVVRWLTHTRPDNQFLRRLNGTLRFAGL